MSKEELELLLKAFKILEEHETDKRKSLATIESALKEEYVQLVMNELAKKKN